MKSLLSLLLCLAVTCQAQTTNTLDKYGGVTTLSGKATGWFRVDKIGSRWFFITPEGNAFFSLGITHTGETIKQDELGVFKSRFNGNQDKLGAFFLDRLHAWSFNTAGYGTLAVMESRIPYVATIWTEGPRSKSAGAKSQNTDIFDPAVQQRLRSNVRTAAQPHIKNPFCLGYVFIDLPIWNLKPDPGPNYVEFLRSLPDLAPGRVALEKFLQAHPDSGVEGLMNHIAETYYSVICSELRQADPHHLILGDRFMAATPSQQALQTPDSILKTAARFVDVISFQPMGTQKPIKGYIDHVFEITGKPVLLADVNTMTMRPARDQKETAEYEISAGKHTREYYLDAAGSAACIGIHRCTIRDYQPWNPQFHRRGLLKADDTEYPSLIEMTKETNEQVFRMLYWAQDPGK